MRKRWTVREIRESREQRLAWKEACEQERRLRIKKYFDDLEKMNQSLETGVLEDQTEVALERLDNGNTYKF